MATRLKRIPAEDVEIHNELEEMRAELEALEEAEKPPVNEALETLYAEMEITGDLESARVFVSKLNFDGANNEARVWEGDAEAYNLERIAKKFGTGQYRVKVYVRIPTGQRVQKASKVYGYKLSREDEERLNAPVTQPSQSGGLTVADVETMFARFAAQMQPAPVAQPNPLAMMKELAEVMKVMTPAPAQPGGMGQMRDMIEIVQLMRESSDPIERGVNASTSDVLLKMVEKFGPLMAGALQMQQPQNMAQAPAPQLQAPPQENPAPISQEDEMSKLQEAQLKMGLGYLVTMAEHAAPPETYAAVILDYAPEENLNQLLAIPGGPIEALARLEPRVKNHVAWFEQVFVELRALMLPDDVMTEKTEPEVKP